MCCFNSMIVRLKAEQGAGELDGKHSFNSMIVRLKVSRPTSQFDEVEFQFYDSPIKRTRRQ